MTSLEQYGKIVKSYTGSGTLVDEGIAMPGSYRLVQYADGKIYLEFFTNEPVVSSEAPFPFGPPSGLRLEGETSDGYTITVPKVTHIGGPLKIPGPRTEPTQKPEARWRFRCPEVSLRSPTAQQPGFASFSLVNLELDGRPLAVYLEGLKVQLWPVENYNAVIGDLRAMRRREVTYQAIVPVMKLDELSELAGKIEDLCSLLTLARGTPITWTNYEIVSEGDEFIGTFGRNVFTKDFRILYLIDRHDRDSMKALDIIRICDIIILFS